MKDSNSGDKMISTKTIVWNCVVSKRIAVVKAFKELDIAMDTNINYDEKYDIWDESKWSLRIAEISWKEYNEIF